MMTPEEVESVRAAANHLLAYAPDNPVGMVARACLALLPPGDDVDRVTKAIAVRMGLEPSYGGGGIYTWRSDRKHPIGNDVTWMSLHGTLYLGSDIWVERDATVRDLRTLLAALGHTTPAAP